MAGCVARTPPRVARGASPAPAPAGARALSLYLHTATFLCLGPRTEGGQGLAGASTTLQTPCPLPLSTTSAWTASMQSLDRDSLIPLSHRTKSASPRAIYRGSLLITEISS
jgi:hypothetical protein